MKCHNILGIQENCSKLVIEKAYADKCHALNKQTMLVSSNILAAKQQELETARDECISWLELPTAEKIKLKIRDGSKRLASPNRLNSVEIGCCTLCDYVCGGLCNDCGKGTKDSFCEYYCGSQTVPIACDIIMYVIVGGIILFYALCGLFKYSKRARAENKRSRYQTAVAQQSELQRNLAASAEKVREVTFAQSVKEKRRRDLNIFADFLEEMGAESTEELRVVENERVLAHGAELQAAQQEQHRVQKQIDRNNKIIQDGP